MSGFSVGLKSDTMKDVNSAFKSKTGRRGSEILIRKAGRSARIRSDTARSNTGNQINSTWEPSVSETQLMSNNLTKSLSAAAT